MTQARRAEHFDVPTEPIDPAHINVRNGEDVKYWTQRFGCTLLQLQLAVKRVGPSPEAVEAHLKRW